jgi:streptogramin lyase
MGITSGPDGNLWCVRPITIDISTVDGFSTALRTPLTVRFPAGITVGPDGDIWFTEYYGNRIGTIRSPMRYHPIRPPGHRFF